MLSPDTHTALARELHESERTRTQITQFSRRFPGMMRGFRVAALTVDCVADLVRVRQLVESEALRDSIEHGDDAWKHR